MPKASNTKKRALISNIKFFLFAVALLMIFVPRTMNISGEVGMRVILTTVGIDRLADGYELTAQIFIPVKGGGEGKETKKTVSATAPSVTEAFNAISAKTARMAAMSHCRLIVLGKSVLETDVVAPLNYFLESNQVNWSAMVAAAENSAKETIEGINKLEHEASISWQKFMLNNKRNALSAGIDIKTFLGGCYSDGAASYISLLMIKTGGGGGGSSGGGGGAESGESGGSGGGQSGGESENMDASLSANERTLIVKDGKVIGELDESSTNALSWMDKKNYQNLLTVTGVDNEFYGSGIISLKCKRKTLKSKVAFEDGVPVFTVNLDLRFVLSEQENKFTGHIEEHEKQRYVQELEDKTESAVRTKIDKMYSEMKNLGADFCSLNDRFRALCFRDYKEFMRDKTPDDLIREMVVRINVRSQVSD